MSRQPYQLPPAVFVCVLTSMWRCFDTRLINVCNSGSSQPGCQSHLRQTSSSRRHSQLHYGVVDVDINSAFCWFPMLTRCRPWWLLLRKQGVSELLSTYVVNTGEYSTMPNSNVKYSSPSYTGLLHWWLPSVAFRSPAGWTKSTALPAYSMVQRQSW